MRQARRIIGSCNGRRPKATTRLNADSCRQSHAICTFAGNTAVYSAIAARAPAGGLLGRSASLRYQAQQPPKHRCRTARSPAGHEARLRRNVRVRECSTPVVPRKPAVTTGAICFLPPERESSDTFFLQAHNSSFAHPHYYRRMILLVL